MTRRPLGIRLASKRFFDRAIARRRHTLQFLLFLSLPPSLSTTPHPFLSFRSRSTFLARRRSELFRRRNLRKVLDYSAARSVSISIGTIFLGGDSLVKLAGWWVTRAVAPAIKMRTRIGEANQQSFRQYSSGRGERLSQHREARSLIANACADFRSVPPRDLRLPFET